MKDWARWALVYEKAPVAVQCTRCDYPIKIGEPVARVPGLDARGYAHQRCVPS